MLTFVMATMLYDVLCCFSVNSESLDLEGYQGPCPWHGMHKRFPGTTQSGCSFTWFNNTELPGIRFKVRGRDNHVNVPIPVL